MCLTQWFSKSPKTSIINITSEFVRIYIIGLYSDILIRISADGTQEAVLLSLPGDSDVHESLRITGLGIRNASC